MIGGPRAAGDQGAGLLRWASLSLLVHGLLAFASLDWTWSPRPASDWSSAPSSPVEVRLVKPPAPPQPGPRSRDDVTPTPQPKPPAPPEPKAAAAIEPDPAPVVPPDPEPEPPVEPETTVTAAPPPKAQRPIEPVPDAAPRSAQKERAEAPPEGPTDAAAEPVEVAALDPAEVSAPPPVPSGPSAAEVDAYIAEVRRRIEERKAYPALARRRGMESRVTVRISIGADGHLVRVETLDAPVGLFERATVEAIEDAAPFPPPPPGFGELEIPLRYTLE